VCARLNREVTRTLEFDWSDKQQAYTLDDQCGRYNNRSMDTQQHPSSADDWPKMLVTPAFKSGYLPKPSVLILIGQQNKQISLLDILFSRKIHRQIQTGSLL